MDNSGKIILGVGVIALAFLFLKNKSTNGGGNGNGATHAFNVGDQIISHERLPTDIIYQITFVDTVNHTYTMGQVWQGGVVNILPGYLWSVIDANYELL